MAIKVEEGERGTRISGTVEEVNDALHQAVKNISDKGSTLAVGDEPPGSRYPVPMEMAFLSGDYMDAPDLEQIADSMSENALLVAGVSL